MYVMHDELTKNGEVINMHIYIYNILHLLLSINIVNLSYI